MRRLLTATATTATTTTTASTATGTLSALLQRAEHIIDIVKPCAASEAKRRFAWAQCVCAVLQPGWCEELSVTKRPSSSHRLVTCGVCWVRCAGACSTLCGMWCTEQWGQLCLRLALRR